MMPRDAELSQNGSLSGIAFVLILSCGEIIPNQRRASLMATFRQLLRQETQQNAALIALFKAFLIVFIFQSNQNYTFCIIVPTVMWFIECFVV